MKLFCFKVSPFQVLTFVLIFIDLFFTFDASLEDDYLEANRLGVCIVTDGSFVKENFGGNEEAAFNHTIYLFQAKKELLKSIFNHTFGFDLRAIKLGHPAFEQIDLDQTSGVINVTELKSSFRLREALSKELFAYPLVLYMTNRAFSDGHMGFKLGSAHSPPRNLVVVSMNGLLEKYKGNYRNKHPKSLLISLIHELLHGIGVQHSNDKDNDVMKEFSPSGLNMSEDTKTQTEILFQWAQKEGLLTLPNDKVRLVSYLSDGQTSEKVVSYHQVVEYMEKREDVFFWTRLWKYKPRLHNIFWLSAILVVVLLISAFCFGKWFTNAQKSRGGEEEMEMPPVDSSQQLSVSIVTPPKLATSTLHIRVEEGS